MRIPGPARTAALLATVGLLGATAILGGHSGRASGTQPAGRLSSQPMTSTAPAGRAGTPTACRRRAPTTATGYARMFARLDPRQWGAADGAETVELDGRSVWLFSDTFSAGRFVHSTAVVQTGGCLHVSQGGAQLLPDDHLAAHPTPADPSRIYWIDGGRAVGRDRLEITARAIDLVGTGPWDFRDGGVSRTAQIRLGPGADLTFLRWTARVHDPAPDPGPMVDCEAPAPPVAHHFCYGRRVHPELRLAGGRVLVSISQNWDDGILHDFSGYRPIFSAVPMSGPVRADRTAHS